MHLAHILQKTNYIQIYSIAMTSAAGTIVFLLSVFLFSAFALVIQNRAMTHCLDRHATSISEDDIKLPISRKMPARYLIDRLSILNAQGTSEKLEESRINIRPIPSLSDIETLTLKSENSPQTINFSQFSGGYPDPSVRDSVYLNLWACLTHEINSIEEDSRTLSNC